MNCSKCENKLPEVLPHTYGSCLKCKGVKDERARWVAAVEGLYEKMKPENRNESMPDDAVAGYYEALDDLLAKMEAPA